jgi:hypothetical protein
MFLRMTLDTCFRLHYCNSAVRVLLLCRCRQVCCDGWAAVPPPGWSGLCVTTLQGAPAAHGPGERHFLPHVICHWCVIHFFQALPAYLLLQPTITWHAAYALQGATSADGPAGEAG